MNTEMGIKQAPLLFVPSGKNGVEKVISDVKNQWLKFHEKQDVYMIWIYLILF